MYNLPGEAKYGGLLAESQTTEAARFNADTGGFYQLGGVIADGDVWIGSIGGAFTVTGLASCAAFEHTNGCDWGIGVGSYAL